MNGITDIPDDYVPPPAPDILGGMAAEIARKLAADQDALIREVITEHVGANWTLEAMLPRLRWNIDPRKPEKILALDDKPILEIWPPRCHRDYNGHSNEIRWTIDWRRL